MRDRDRHVARALYTPDVYHFGETARTRRCDGIASLRISSLLSARRRDNPSMPRRKTGCGEKWTFVRAREAMEKRQKEDIRGMSFSDENETRSEEEIKKTNNEKENKCERERGSLIIAA